MTLLMPDVYRALLAMIFYYFSLSWGVLKHPQELVVCPQWSAFGRTSLFLIEGIKDVTGIVRSWIKVESQSVGKSLSVDPDISLTAATQPRQEVIFGLKPELDEALLCHPPILLDLSFKPGGFSCSPNYRRRLPSEFFYLINYTHGGSSRD